MSLKTKCQQICQQKFSKTQVSEISQSGGSFGSCLGNLGKKAQTNIAIPLARDSLPGLVSNLTLNAIINLIEKQGEKQLSEQEKDLL